MPHTTWGFFLPLSGPKENIYRSTIYSNQFINQNPPKRLRRTKKMFPKKHFGGIEKTEWLSFGQSVVTLKLSVTVITAKLWCHILLVRGVNWATELRSFYTEIVCRGQTTDYTGRICFLISLSISKEKHELYSVESRCQPPTYVLKCE